MTDEERARLVRRLRSSWSTVEDQVRAADEIERLAEENQLLERRLKGLESEIVCMSYDLVR